MCVEHENCRLEQLYVGDECGFTLCALITSLIKYGK